MVVLSTATSMEIAGGLFCMPLTLLINLSLLQCLLTEYLARRREIRVVLLFLCAFLGFATLVPLALADPDLVQSLNDISETSSTMTFLLQITITGHDLNKRVQFRSIQLLSYVSEVLLAVGFVLIIANLVDVIAPGAVALGVLEPLDNVMENVFLAFIFLFRFYYLSIAKGWCATLQAHRWELLFYLLFVTHEYPFVLLNAYTAMSWEKVQALWNRCTIFMCVMKSVEAKLRSSMGQSGHHTRAPSAHSQHSKAPSQQRGVSPFGGASGKSLSGASKVSGGSKRSVSSKRSQGPRNDMMQGIGVSTQRTRLSAPRRADVGGTSIRELSIRE